MPLPQTNFRTILIATDFGEPSEHAVEVGLSIAAKFEARVILAHAVWVPPLAYAYAEGIPWPIEAYEEAARRGLDASLKETTALYANVEPLLLFGEPSSVLLDAARDRHADLLVLGTHGRRGISRMVMGSVAEKIVRQSSIPVLTVGPKGA